MSNGGLTAVQLTVPGRLQGVDLEVRPGELLGLLGPNGAGKSTLLSELSGAATRQVAPRRSAATQVVHGTVSWRGRPLSAAPARERARAIGYLPQQVVSAWDLSVRDVVALGRLPWGDEGQAESVDQAMHQTDVWALRSRSVRTLSGGEWARVCLALVLAGEPEVMLVDEPTSHLDVSHQLQVMALLQAQAQSGRAVVVAVHDLGLAARYCHRLVLLHQGRVAAQGSVDEVLRPDLLRTVYGVAVHVDLQAVPPVVLPC
jgi:iron complex transport system ATP-binding protein